MQHTGLRYGSSTLTLEFDNESFTILAPTEDPRPLTDIEIGERLDDPIDSDRIEEIVGPGSTVLIVVPDATREVGCGQVVNLLVRRLIANGINAFDIRIIFATGIHRKVTENERSAILTPFIAQRIKTLDHGPRDLMQIVRYGKTDDGIPVELNRAIGEHDHVILIGGVSYHYFAGFTGGRKLICPGLASARTIAATHALAFDCDTRDRRSGVDTAMLDGNAVHASFIDAVRRVNVSFAINTIVDRHGRVTDLYCGNWISSHRAACERFDMVHAIGIDERREVVIVSCGGSPHDIDMIQAHKALDAAARACTEGGRIILIAECPGGTGRADLLSWFEAENSAAIAERLCSNYQVSGQTAWSMLRKAETYDVSVFTRLERPALSKMRLNKIDAWSEIVEIAARAQRGYIMPEGARVRVIASY